MKKLILALLICLPLVTFAQSEPPRDEQGKIVYQEVVNVDADQAELYKRALRAIPRDGKEVLKVDATEVSWQDKKDMIIDGMGQKIPVRLHYTATLQGKDGRYKYSISNLLLETKQGRGATKTPVEDGSVYKPLPKNLYYKSGALKPQGQTILAIQESYQREIDKAIVSSIESIKRTMALPIGENW
ncbi:hypothetical protein [Pontibacter rugosus]|uniref:DUF4468 domain-containing protein n=1 Tax=Pontibacter rugosus TaxID=1745966 RepID=A0ABW3SJZ7_9BACT